MRLIVGLGNPGAQYSRTRHNVGRSLVEFVGRHHALSFTKKKSLSASLATFEWEGQALTLAYPETFMNLSGKAVGALVRYLGLDPHKDLLIAVDDAALPFGILRLRARGSDGGHNGLRSIQSAIGSSEFARLRMGIGPKAAQTGNTAEPLEDYVLSPFSPKEKRLLKDFLEKGVEACRLWFSQPIASAMSVINQVKIEG